MVGFYVENKAQWAEKYRSVRALRGDEAIYNVTNLTPPYTASDLTGAPVINFAQLNSGSASKFLPSPKASLFFGAWAKTQFYIQGVIQFSQQRCARHNSNELNSISPDYPFPNALHPNFLPWFLPKARKSACALWPCHICKVLPFDLVSIQRFRVAAVGRVIPEARLLRLRQAIARHRMGELLHAAETFVL